MDPQIDDEIIDSICQYSEQRQIKRILQEYLKRLILQKPADPIKFLIESIEKDPFVPEETKLST